jgi:hypothetical protein
MDILLTDSRQFPRVEDRVRAYGDDQNNLENPADTSDNMHVMTVEQVFEALKKAIK